MVPALHDHTDARLALRNNRRIPSSLPRHVSKPAACTVTLTFPSRGPVSVSAETLPLLLECTVEDLKRKELRWMVPPLPAPSRRGRVRGEMKVAFGHE